MKKLSHDSFTTINNVREQKVGIKQTNEYKNYEPAVFHLTNLQQKRNNLTENKIGIYISSKLLAKFQHWLIRDNFDHEIRIG